jgi:hypothetical protein
MKLKMIGILAVNEFEKADSIRDNDIWSRVFARNAK